MYMKLRKHRELNVSNEREDFERMMKVIHSAALCISLLCDNLEILSKIKFFKFNEHILARRASYFELIAHVTKLMYHLQQYLDIYLELQKLSHLHNTERLAKLKRERLDTFFKISLSACDLFVVVDTLQFMPSLFGFKINEGVVAFAGVIAAVLGILNAY